MTHTSPNSILTRPFLPGGESFFILMYMKNEPVTEPNKLRKEGEKHRWVMNLMKKEARVVSR